MIGIGSDHAGLELKSHIIKYFKEKGITYKDYGAYEFEQNDNYVDFTEKVCVAIQNKECEKGILVCATGIGNSMAANKMKGIRASLCGDTYSAKMSKMHNNANVLSIGARVIGSGLALDIVDIWLNTEFEGGRHIERVNDIMEIENK